MTTCVGCDRRWAALGEVHCAVCHEHFSCYGAFDLHVLGVEEINHRNPADIKNKKTNINRLVARDTKHGSTWGFAGNWTRE